MDNKKFCFRICFIKNLKKYIDRALNKKKHGDVISTSFTQP